MLTRLRTLWRNRRHCPDFGKVHTTPDGSVYFEGVDFSQPSKLRCFCCGQPIIARIHEAPSMLPLVLLLAGLTLLLMWVLL